MSYCSNFAVADTCDLLDPILINLDQTSADAVQPVGDTVWSKDGRKYQFVYFDSTGDDVFYAGYPLVWGDSTTDYMVEADISNAHSVPVIPGQGFAGVACAANADNNNYYGWVQQKGFCPGARGGTGVAANEPVTASTSNVFDILSSVLSGEQGLNVGIALGAATDAVGGGVSTFDLILD